MNPLFAGATIGAWLMPVNEKELVINNIRTYVKNIGTDFKNILRLDQDNNRFTYITFIKSSPLKKSTKYRSSFVIGLFYEDHSPQNGIQFKQDFVVSIGNEYRFVIGDTWLKQFPELEKYRKQYIWNFKEFDGEIANGLHYQNDGQFNHHYRSFDELPLEIAKHYSRKYHLL